MLTGNKIPFVNQNKKMKTALDLMSSKKLGILVVRNNKNLTIGIVTAGDLKRAIQKNKDIQNLSIKNSNDKKSYKHRS